MANQVISVDRKKYAVGLFWQPTGAGYVARNYARTLARSVDKKLNLYVEYRSMVGLGARRVGHRSGMDCAAVAVMDTLAEYSSFLAVFAVGRQFYLVAVRNGVILEDKLFDKEEDARAEYFKLSIVCTGCMGNATGGRKKFGRCCSAGCAGTIATNQSGTCGCGIGYINCYLCIYFIMVFP